MGQATLAFRNFLVRAAIFVVLAAILAWVVGGTLFGKHRVIFPSIAWDGRGWAAQVIGSGTRPDDVQWRLLWKVGDEAWTVAPICQKCDWVELVGPFVDEQGLWLRVAEKSSPQTTGLKWSLVRFPHADSQPTVTPISNPAPTAP